MGEPIVWATGLNGRTNLFLIFGAGWCVRPGDDAETWVAQIQFAATQEHIHKEPGAKWKIRESGRGSASAIGRRYPRRNGMEIRDFVRLSIAAHG